jgi:hypothetical protein
MPIDPLPPVIDPGSIAPLPPIYGYPVDPGIAPPTPGQYPIGPSAPPQPGTGGAPKGTISPTVLLLGGGLLLFFMMGKKGRR